MPSEIHSLTHIPYTGHAPIATCHWQGLANILAVQGLPEALSRLGLSWGASWASEEGILYGGRRWLGLANRLYGLELEDASYDDVEAAGRHEAALLDAGLPFVAEIDAFYVPSPYWGSEHVVHTIIVLSKNRTTVVYVDATNQPSPASCSLEEYFRMRSSACEGRTSGFRLYASRKPATSAPSARAVLEAVAEDLARSAPDDDAALHAVTSWLSETTRPVNVCRAAAERYQAARLFAFLGHDLPAVRTTGRALGDLADRWYLIHMLTASDRIYHPRQRERVRRLIEALSEEERAVRKAIIGQAEADTTSGVA